MEPCAKTGVWQARQVALSTRPRRAAPPRRPARHSVGEIVDRLAALEERLARVEEGRPPPGDGRTTPGPLRKAPKRCLGCGLPLQRKAGRCRWCGRPL